MTMNRTALGLALVALGIALALLAGFAHLLGLTLTPSKTGADTFGSKQIVGVVVGVAVAVAGLVIARTARDERGGGPRPGDTSDG